ncbi:hyaluronan mediated motility receptor [Brienomyrus brachyistius]|uniref:hyaluronan mediated motility receptor n=1 Tax=Brienomyrus brachyistius TaxID=42636 RepID=UPI0020B196F3|nr:hyaluronan mediated motility receptor [Brienomyrus brachyistius]
MSFSRAPIKRFNEHIGCAPPPGSYEVKNGEVKGAVSFRKTERFRAAKAADLASPAKDVLMSPMRRTMSADGLAEGLSQRKEKSNVSAHIRQQKLLEREIRFLVQQRGEQDRVLQTQEEETRKMEAKLLAAVREKSGLSSNVASLERQMIELKKANEFLKTKVSADTAKKRINSLSLELIEAKNKLDVKDKELSYLQISSEGQVKLLEKELETLRVTLDAVKDRGKDLDKLYQDNKAQNEELATETDKLTAVIHELENDIKVLQGYLDTANEEIQCLRLKLQEGSSEADSKMSESMVKLRDLEHQLKQCTEELSESRNALGEKEQELERRDWALQDSRSTCGEVERQLEQRTRELRDSQNAVSHQEQELARLRDILRRTEEELDQRVALLGERCLHLEEERGKTQEEGLRRVEELKVEITTLQDKRKADQESYWQLQQAHRALAELLEEEKSRVSSLSDLVERLQAETKAERCQLEAELEEVLEEVSQLEAQEQRSEEAMQHLEQANRELQMELKRVQAEVERKDLEMKEAEERHLLEMRELQEGHSLSWKQIGEMATELESAKKSSACEMPRLKAQCQELEEEVKKVKQQFEEEHQQLQDSQLSLGKAKDDHARALLDVQTRLAERDAELRSAAESHTSAVVQLQCQVDQEKMERQKLQGLLGREQSEKESLEESLETRLAEIEELRAQLEQLQQEKQDLQRQTEQERMDLKEQMEDEKRDLQRDMERERLVLEKQMEQERCDLEQKMEERINYQRLHKAELRESTADSTELGVWRKRYEELYAKVKPFQEQLDSFSAERDALLNENGATQEELNRLADAYARLLGHQNQRQKIKHVMKLKEENISLKQEASKLRAQVTRQKKDLEQLKASQVPRRFDPSKAFKHESKENHHPSSILRQGN